MSSFEIYPSQPFENPNIRLPLSEQLNDDWCAMFNAAYGWQGRRAVVIASSYVRQERRRHCERPSAPIYRSTVPKEPKPEGFVFDGEVLGARMVPLMNDEQILHLVMKDVIDVETDVRYERPEAIVWIPLGENGKLYENVKELILY